MLKYRVAFHHGFITPLFDWGCNFKRINSFADQLFTLFIQTTYFLLPHRYIINLQYIENSAHTPP